MENVWCFGLVMPNRAVPSFTIKIDPRRLKMTRGDFDPQPYYGTLEGHQRLTYIQQNMQKTDTTTKITTKDHEH
jgi:hypothetical protein